MQRITCAFVVFGMLVVGGCEREPEVPVAPVTPGASVANPPPVAAEPEAVTIGDVRNVHLVAGCYTAGAPTEADFALIAKQGVKAVINVREASETTFDEAAAAKGAGLEYYHIPFSKPDTLTDEKFDRVREALKKHAGKDVFIHCGSANRVGAVWYAKRVLDDGVEPDAALTEAKTVGLRSGWLIEKADAYITRQRKN